LLNKNLIKLYKEAVSKLEQPLFYLNNPPNLNNPQSIFYNLCKIEFNDYNNEK